MAFESDWGCLNKVKKGKDHLISLDEVRANRPSLTQLEDQRLKSDFRTTTNGWAGGLLARTESLSIQPSKQQPRSTLVHLSCDNRRTHYTAPL
ncbi:hypothetical protein J6590_028513, partial [Homalodisca vitripennis]